MAVVDSFVFLTGCLLVTAISFKIKTLVSCEIINLFMPKIPLTGLVKIYLVTRYCEIELYVYGIIVRYCFYVVLV